MKKYLLLLLGCIVSITGQANRSFEINGFRYAECEDMEVEVTGVYWTWLDDITIPNSFEYGGVIYTVTGIGDEAFYQCENIKSVTIPNSVTSIGRHAFYGCSNLTSVTIPNSSLTSIGESAFMNCISLTSITIPNSLASIGDYAFCQCYSLTNVTIPNSVTSIGRSAFSGCSGLTSITIPNSVTSIGRSAFSGCSGLTSIYVDSGNSKYDSRNNCNAIIETASNTLIAGCNNTTIPNSVTSIGTYAFDCCSSLTSITIPNSVTSIGDRAFCYCSGLTSITIPSSVTSIGYSVFYSCRSLTSIVVETDNTIYDSRNSCNAIIETPSNTLIAGCKNTTIPNSVTSIGDYAFDGYYYLTSVTIPNSVTSIGKHAFLGCSGLTSITIPNSVTSIRDSSFYSCSGLTSITIPNSVTSIGNGAFDGCSSLKNVTIPNSVTSIGDNAFCRCSSLTSVDIPNSVTSIGGFAFYNCSGLTSITIPNSVTSIGERSFDYTAWYNNKPNGLVYAGKVAYKYKGTMPANTSISLQEGTLGITSSAFGGCSNLTSVTIPNSVTSIGINAFYGCSGLTKAEFASIESLCNISYNNYSANPLYYAHHLYIDGIEIKDLTIPNSVTSIGNYAFYGCSGLTSVTIPNSVTSIGKEAFYGCSGLTSVTIPNSVTSIGNYAFYGCSGLTSVTIPNSVTSIGKEAFRKCSGLTSIQVENGNSIYDSRNDCNAIIESGTNTLLYGCQNTVIPNSVTSIGNNAFYGCSLASASIPNSVTSIGNNAFYGCSGLMGVKVDLETPLSISSSTFSNRTNATLVVPVGSKTAYQAADYWKEFKRIIEDIDGDVNGDGESDVVDVVDIARYVVGTPAETFVEILADINNNGEVNIADAVCLVNDIAGDQNFAKPMGSPSKPETTSDALMLTQGSNGLSLLLENQRYYTAFQFDLYVPEGVDVMQMMLNAQRKQKHQLLYNKVEEGHWRVAALSTSNRTFADNSGELLSFTLAGNANGDIVVSDIHFFTPDGEDCTFNDIQMKVGVATDIQTAGNLQQTADNPDVYDLSGRKIENSKWSNRQLPKGIYIVNGKKVIIK